MAPPPALRNLPEKAWRLALLGLYAALHVRLFPYWELSGDDGHSLAAAWRALDALYWFGPSSSLGVAHSSVVYIVYSLFLRVHESWTSVQAGLLLAHLGAHWLLIGEARRAYSTPAAYLASLLAFVNPNFFVHYDQRFWEPGLLPLFSTLAWVSLLALARTGRWRHEFTFLLALLGACSAHLASIFLLIPFAVVPRQAARGWREAAATLCSAGLLALVASPYLPWAWGRSHALAALAATLSVGLAWPQPRRLLVWPGLRRLATFATFAFSALFACYWLFPPRVDPAYKLAVLFDLFGEERATYLAASLPIPAWHLYPGLALFFLFLARELRAWPELASERRLTLFWLAAPLCALLVTGPAYRWFPPHWILFLFPVAWLGVAETLVAAKGLLRHARAGLALSGALAASALTIEGASSWSLTRHALATGGVGTHMASLHVKLQAMDKIYRDPGYPEVIYMIYPYDGAGYKTFDFSAWCFLTKRYRSRPEFRAPASRGFYYVYQERWPYETQDLRDRLEAAPGVTKEKVGPLTVYHTKHLVEGTGLRMVTDFD